MGEFPFHWLVTSKHLASRPLTSEPNSRRASVKLIPDAVVTVSVKAPNGNRVFVIGKVNRPGDFPLLRPTDVMQALSLAGGATPYASTDKIRVLHRDGPHQTSIRFRYSQVAGGRNLEQNVLLQSGDTVIVP
jgi:polysaccharide export outer membrane protein